MNAEPEPTWPEPEPDFEVVDKVAEARWLRAAWMLAANLTACKALAAGQPVPRRQLRRKALGALGEPDVGPDLILTDEIALQFELRWQNTTTFEIPVQSARTIAESPEPDASDQLLGPLVVRRQRTILGAHTGAGKSTAILAMLASITLERDFLDWKGTGGRGLVLDLEQGLRTLKRRVHEAGLDTCETIDFARVPDGLSLNVADDPEKEGRWEQRGALEDLLATGEYDVVCIDPLYKAHTGDSNAEREAVDLMRYLDGLREAFGFALIVATHCRKPQPGSKFSIHDVFGSSAYVRGAEIVLGLQRLRDGYSRLHFLKDRDGDLPIGQRWGLLFTHEDGFKRDPKDGQPGTQERLRELREADPEITQTQAAEALGVSDRTIRKYWHDDTQESLLDGD